MCPIFDDGALSSLRWASNFAQLDRASAQLNLPPQPPTAPTQPEPLSPTQQALESTLRIWRKSESERLGLPQFFVLGTSTLRSIVLIHPRTLPQLSSIPGIGPEKLDKFGPAILALCNP